MYMHTRNDVSVGECFQNLQPEQDRQTDRQTEAIPNAAHQHVAFVVGKKIYNTDIITF